MLCTLSVLPLPSLCSSHTTYAVGVVGGVLALGLLMFPHAAGISHYLFKAYRGPQPGSGGWKVVIKCISNLKSYSFSAMKNEWVMVCDLLPVEGCTLYRELQKELTYLPQLWINSFGKEEFIHKYRNKTWGNSNYSLYLIFQESNTQTSSQRFGGKQQNSGYAWPKSQCVWASTLDKLECSGN